MDLASALGFTRDWLRFRALTKAPRTPLLSGLWDGVTRRIRLSPAAKSAVSAKAQMRLLAASHWTGAGAQRAFKWRRLSVSRCRLLWDCRKAEW